MTQVFDNTPSGWKRARIDDIAEVRSGGTPSRAKHELFFEGGIIPWVKTMDLTNGPVLTTDEKITQLGLQESSCTMLEPDTILVAMYGGFNQIGRTGLMTFRGAINQALSALVINQRQAIPEYVLAWLNGNVSLWRRIAASSRKDPNITRSDVIGFPILLPPLAEQRKIAAILGTWDAAIATTARLIAALRERKRGLMQRLLTGEVRFPGFEDEWEEVKLGDIAYMQGGGTPSTQESAFWEGSMPWITGADFQENLQLSRIRRYISEEAVKNSTTTVASKGSVLVVSRTGVGKLAMAPFDVAISQDITALSTSSEFIDNHYLLFSLHNNLSQFVRFNQGTSINGVTRRDLKEHIVKLPSLTEQKYVSRILNTQMVQIEQLMEYRIALQQQKRGLMQRLLTGQVRVQVDTEEAHHVESPSFSA